MIFEVKVGRKEGKLKKLLNDETSLPPLSSELAGGNGSGVVESDRVAPRNRSAGRCVLKQSTPHLSSIQRRPSPSLSPTPNRPQAHPSLDSVAERPRTAQIISNSIIQIRRNRHQTRAGNWERMDGRRRLEKIQFRYGARGEIRGGIGFLEWDCVEESRGRTSTVTDCGSASSTACIRLELMSF